MTRMMKVIIFAVLFALYFYDFSHAEKIDSRWPKNALSNNDLKAANFLISQNHVRVWAISLGKENRVDMVGLGVIVGKDLVLILKKIFYPIAEYYENKEIDDLLILVEDFNNFHNPDSSGIFQIFQANIFEDFIILDAKRDFHQRESANLAQDVKQGDIATILVNIQSVAPLFIEGEIYYKEGKLVIVEAQVDEKLIDNQISHGLSVWDSNGNFIGFLKEYMGDNLIMVVMP